MTVTIANVQSRTETDLDDTTLQRILDAAVLAIERVAGSATEEVTNFIDARNKWVVVSRPALSITSVIERKTHRVAGVTLAADDYRQVGDYRFLRLQDGTNPALAWGAEVEITFVPLVDAAIRDRVAIDLCMVDIEFRAYDSEKSADWSGSQKDWKARRRELLSQVQEGRSPFV